MDVQADHIIAHAQAVQAKLLQAPAYKPITVEQALGVLRHIEEEAPAVWWWLAALVVAFSVALPAHPPDPPDAA